MTDDQDRRLSALLSEAVEPVQPAERLGAIRMAVRPDPRPRWSYALAAAVGTAAVVVAIAVAGGQLTSPTPAPTDPATSPVTSATDDPVTDAPTPGSTVAVYYVGDTEAAGPRLFREFRRLPTSDDLDAAVKAAVGRAPDDSSLRPLDPDYRSAWPGGTTAGASFEGDGTDGMFTVDLGGDPEDPLRERPPGMSEAEAQMAVEQLVWTAQAAGQVRAPVRILLYGEITDQVLGVPTSEPLARGATLEVLNLASLTTPAQGATVTEDTLEVTGVANSIEANVTWQVLRDGEAVLDGYTTAEGWMDERLFPFETRIDVSRLDPGSYTVRVSTDDPSGGTEGTGPMRDTREITIE